MEHDMAHCLIENYILEVVHCNITQKIYLTRINKEFDGDTFFTDIDSSWKVINSQSFNYLEFDYEFLEYLKKPILN